MGDNTPKTVSIKRGENLLILSNLLNWNYDISKIVFKTNVEKYKFNLQKIGYGTGPEIIYNSKSGENIPIAPFTAFRDGLHTLKLKSSTNGKLIIYYSKFSRYYISDEELERTRKSELSHDNHYKKYMSFITHNNIEWVIMDEKIHNFTYHPDHVEIAAIYNDNELAYKPKTNIIRNNIIPRFFDIITEIKVNALKETEMYIELNYGRQFGEKMIVKPGENIYKIILPIRKFLRYTGTYLIFEEPKNIINYSVNGIQLFGNKKSFNNKVLESPVKLYLGNKKYDIFGGCIT